MKYWMFLKYDNHCQIHILKKTPEGDLFTWCNIDMEWERLLNNDLNEWLKMSYSFEKSDCLVEALPKFEELINRFLVKEYKPKFMNYLNSMI